MNIETRQRIYYFRTIIFLMTLSIINGQQKPQNRFLPENEVIISINLEKSPGDEVTYELQEETQEQKYFDTSWKPIRQILPVYPEELRQVTQNMYARKNQENRVKVAPLTGQL